MSTTIIRPATAFASSSRRQKHPRVKDRDYLGFLHTLPCVISGARPVEAAHIRYAAPEYGKRETGKSEKPDDRWALPLSPELHREQHAMSERAFWERYGLDPCSLALALHVVGKNDDHETALMIVQAANKRAAQHSRKG